MSARTRPLPYTFRVRGGSRGNFRGARVRICVRVRTYAHITNLSFFGGMSAPDRASPLLRRVLMAAGYHLEDRPLGLRAIRRADRRAVFVVASASSIEEIASEFPDECVRRTIVCAEDPGEPARAFAAEHGLEVLVPETLGSALGEMLLLGPPVESAEPVVPGPVTVPPLAFPNQERTIRPRLTREDAERAAGVDGFRYTLRLVPYFVFSYRVRTAAPHGGVGPVTDHLAAVNAISGKVEYWENREPEFVAEIEDPHQRLEPSISEVAAQRSADETTRRRHTVSVDHSEQHGGALIIERRRVPPGPDDLHFSPPVLVHFPYWYVESADGRVVLDAVTGAKAPESEGESAA